MLIIGKGFKMKLAIMQPYFFPYIGYFQLIKSVDQFVIYDNIKYTKKGWINRNRILVNGTVQYISLPLKRDSDSLNIDQRVLSGTWDQDRQKILCRIKEAYRKAPYFNQTFEIINEILKKKDLYLFEFLYASIIQICRHLNIETKFVISSSIEIDHELKSTFKIIKICKYLGATDYFNSIGGESLYSKEQFAENGLKLYFIKPKPGDYRQLNNGFISNLSIIDVMMFNSIQEIGLMLTQYNVE